MLQSGNSPNGNPLEPLWFGRFQRKILPGALAGLGTPIRPGKQELAGQLIIDPREAADLQP
jgi:hypothetical protein